MKIAISTDNGYVSPHFGRCASYTIAEIKEGKVLHTEEIPNPGHEPGFLPKYLSDKGVTYIIAGGMGPRAQGLFAQNDIKTIIGVQGPIDKVIKDIISQDLKPGVDMCEHADKPEDHPRSRYYTKHRQHPEKLKICITSRGMDLDSEVDPSFGRAQYFLIVDSETMDVEALENPSKEALQGAGIQTAQLIASKNVNIVLTGNCGPNAERVLNLSGIKIITGINGNVKDAILKFRQAEK